MSEPYHGPKRKVYKVAARAIITRTFEVVAWDEDEAREVGRHLFNPFDEMDETAKDSEWTYHESVVSVEEIKP